MVDAAEAAIEVAIEETTGDAEEAATEAAAVTTTTSQQEAQKERQNGHVRRTFWT